MNKNSLQYAVVDNREIPSIITNPSSVTVELNDRVTLSCAASGNPTPNIQWYKDNKAIEGPQAIGNTFVIPEATPNVRGFYQCEAFSSFGNPSRSTEAVLLISGWNAVMLTIIHAQYNLSFLVATFLNSVLHGIAKAPKLNEIHIH